MHLSGEVSEWSIVHPWKGCVPLSVPGVRIPLSPPMLHLNYFLCSFIIRFMKSFIQNLNSILEMLESVEHEINLAGYSLTEKKVFFTIVQLTAKEGSCNITDVINVSNLSRSTVYKAIKKLEQNMLLRVKQSSFDKRESYLTVIS